MKDAAINAQTDH